MKIELIISTHTLGDFNTDADNQRYAKAVLDELGSEFPNADVSVDLVSNVTDSFCLVNDDPIGEVEEKVNLIAHQVWDKADY